MATPTVLLYIGLESSTETFFVLDDPVRGLLDGATYTLGGDVAVDITTESQTINIRRGRGSEFEEMGIGSASIGWPNDARTFDPLYAGSPYFGSDLIGKRLQVLVGSQILFDGITEDWDFDYDVNGVSWVTVSAMDAFAKLGDEEFDAWTSTPSLPGARLTEILDRNEVRFGSNRDLDVGVNSLQGDNVAYGSNVLNYMRLVAKSDWGRLFIDSNGVLVFQDRIASLNQPAEAIFADTEAAGILFQTIKRTRGTELIFNRVSVDREGGIKQTSEDVASETKYGVRALSVGGLLLTSDATSKDMADYLLSLYVLPITRIKSLSVILDGMDSAKAGAVLALELGDIAQVLFTPNQIGAQINTLVTVEGISHSLSTSGVHTASFSFSTTDGRTFFTLDSATLGLLDGAAVLAF